MTNTTETAEAPIEGRLFGFLARLWIAEPDEGVIQYLSDASTRVSYESLGGFVPDGELAEIVDELGCEYCACFLGPKGHLPPHQSVVEQSHFQGECLSSLQKFAEIIGLSEDPIFEQQSQLDHIGQLLAMSQRICDSEAGLSSEALDQLKDLRNVFVSTHLAWIPRYCEVASGRMKSKFYLGLAEVTSKFLQQYMAIEK